jgi:hypothetical protein
MRAMLNCSVTVQRSRQCEKIETRHEKFRVARRKKDKIVWNKLCASAMCESISKKKLKVYWRLSNANRRERRNRIGLKMEVECGATQPCSISF